MALQNGLPASFRAAGFLPASEIWKRKRLLIGTDGPTNSGKTEWALSAPGPILYIGLDRGLDGVLSNPRPPAWRRPDVAYKIVTVPLATQADQKEYLQYWRDFYEVYKKALANPDVVTVILDGDSDSWELQRLAEFGRLTQIPPMLYTQVNAARRAMIARAWDSGKIFIATNRVKDEYVNVYDEKGQPKVDSQGRELRAKSGELERQGFADQDYLYSVQVRHFYREAAVNKITGKEIPATWGFRIMKCKPDMNLHGMEFTGDDCNFATLVQAIYPGVSLKEWGL